MDEKREGPTLTPEVYSTPRRPGQPGEERQTRAGPNPRSAHPTGPHAPYDPQDPEGLSAEKHYSEAVVTGSSEADRPSPSGTINCRSQESRSGRARRRIGSTRCRS